VTRSSKKCCLCCANRAGNSVPARPDLPVILSEA
jgi:hypothetical protein